MNKKQVIVLWMTAIALCLAVVVAPKYYISCSQGSDKCVTWDEPIPGGFTRVKWDVVMQTTLVIIILSAVTLYTLRSRKDPGA